MKVTSLDAALVSKMFLAGAKNLESKKEWINELNVFPVPDGDTGTNMTMTIMSAVDAVTSVEATDMKAVAKAISSGSLRGARGNSGVILSQLLRGFSKGITDFDGVTVEILTDAFQRAVETAYKAVMKPKEGTILTVAKGAANKALEICGTTDDIVVFMDEVIKEAEAVLEKTPDMLPVLKQAGVVDSGGQGLVEFLHGTYDALIGKEVDYSAFEAKKTGVGPAINEADIEESAENIKFGYCTEFIILLEKPVADEEVLKYKAFLESIGDSIVCVADDDLIKTHVHTNDPGKALQKALTFGQLSRIKIDNMREEHKEKLRKEIEKDITEAADKVAEPTKEMGFVSVATGDGMVTVFKDLGCDEMISGGQTMNPSTEDIINAVKKVPASTVFVLPNNKNIILAAEQAAKVYEEKKIVVVPTKTIPQGITALINFIPDESVEDNKARMTDEIANVKTGQITYAVRDTQIDDKEIHKDDYMGVGDSGILAVDKDLKKTFMDMLEEMVDEDSAIISIYYGEDVTEDDAQAIVEDIEATYPDLDIELQQGGQAVYYYIVSVE